MKTHLDFAYERERTSPKKVWLTEPMGAGVVREFTFRQAMDEARRMAAHLRSLDLPPKSHIALFAKNNAWWFLADLAIGMAGHVSVPLYPTLTPDTIRQILEHSESRLIFVGKLDEFEQMKPGIPAGLPIITLPLSPPIDAPKWSDLVAKTEPLAGEPARDTDDLATIIYTSGSTGVPKGVMHTFRTMSAAMAIGEVVGFGPNDRMLSYLPLAHALERAVVELPSLRYGMHIYFAETLDTFVEDLRRARPTIFVSVPRLWSKFQQGVFAKTPPERLSLLLRIPVLRGIVRKKILSALGLEHVRYAASGSAPIPGELLDWYRSLGLELLEGYAMTENFAVSHATRPGEVRVGWVGTPHDGVEQRLSEDGEVLVRSPGNMLGYFKNEALTAEVLDAEGFVHTGDLGELDERGRLKITGRMKELFKTSKGKYVAPAPIENALTIHDDIEQALVGGAGMPQPFGLVVLAEHARARISDAAARRDLIRSLEDLLARTNATLDDHERLHALVVVDEPWTIEGGLLTPTLKIKRSAIEARYAPEVERWYAEKARVIFRQSSSV
jgi:long-subunit acyl-CoA synthetase (AMP-forming)